MNNLYTPQPRIRMHITAGSLILTIVVLSGLQANGQAAAKWTAAAEACALKNPLEGNTAVLGEAGKIYISLCAPCHGDKGKGDGPVAAALNPHPADHTSGTIQSETDGSLYYKMTTGRGQMPPLKMKLTDAQRWSLVNYIRTLKK